jgi:hypothetical protein
LTCDASFVTGLAKQRPPSQIALANTGRVGHRRLRRRELDLDVCDRGQHVGRRWLRQRRGRKLDRLNLLNHARLDRQGHRARRFVDVDVAHRTQPQLGQIVDQQLAGLVLVLIAQRADLGPR